MVPYCFCFRHTDLLYYTPPRVSTVFWKWVQIIFVGFYAQINLFCLRNVFVFSHPELASGKSMHVLFQMVWVKNVLCIGEQLFRHVRNPCRPITDKHCFLITSVTVLNRTALQMPAKLSRSTDIGNILPFSI